MDKTTPLVKVGSLPTAQQSALDVHVTPATPAPLGRVWGVQCDPGPSVVETTTPALDVTWAPTAKQLNIVHAMAL